MIKDSYEPPQPNQPKGKKKKKSKKDEDDEYDPMKDEYLDYYILRRF